MYEKVVDSNTCYILFNLFHGFEWRLKLEKIAYPGLTPNNTYNEQITTARIMLKFCVPELQVMDPTQFSSP